MNLGIELTQTSHKGPACLSVESITPMTTADRYVYIYTIELMQTSHKGRAFFSVDAIMSMTTADRYGWQNVC